MSISKLQKHANGFPFPNEETRRQWSDLEKKLLAIGGKQVVWRGRESHLKELVRRGRLFEQRVQERMMDPNQCHQNAASLWVKDIEGTTIITGYALHLNDRWIQHSWVVKGKRLIETTCRADKYFGVALDEEEAFRFWLANFAAPDHMNLSTADICRDYPQVIPLSLKVLERHGYMVIPPERCLSE